MNTSFRNPLTPTRKTIRNLLAIVLVSVAISACAEWKPGTPLPELKSFGLEGALPANMTGKVLLVDFWASWCTPCKASFPTLNALQVKYASSGLIVLAINIDDKESAMKNFLADNPVSFTVVRDAGKKAVANAAVETMPSSFLIDRSGKVRFLHSGFHGEKTADLYAREIELLLKEEVKQ